MKCNDRPAYEEVVQEILSAAAGPLAVDGLLVYLGINPLGLCIQAFKKYGKVSLKVIG